MRKYASLFIFLALILQAGPAQADKEQAVFAIQKAKATIEKGTTKSEEAKTPILELGKAREHVEQAEAVLKANTSLLGKLKKEAEPEIFYLAEMAEINVSIAMSRIEKINQEKENARLEKMIPEIEGRIKVFYDKNAEIQRLKDQLRKPANDLTSLSVDVAQLKKDKTDLSDQLSKLKLEKENISGKVELLGAENQRLKSDLKALETQKGSDIVEMRAKLQSTTRQVDFFKALGKMGLVAKVTDRDYTYILPRKDLVKSTPKGPALTDDAARYLAKFAELLKAFPETKLKLDVHGYGNPAKSEDKKSTETMAQLLKKALVEKGVGESAIQAAGSGSGSPMFSKSAVEENRRIEITVYQ